MILAILEWVAWIGLRLVCFALCCVAGGFWPVGDVAGVGCAVGARVLVVRAAGVLGDEWLVLAGCCWMAGILVREMSAGWFGAGWVLSLVGE